MSSCVRRKNSGGEYVQFLHGLSVEREPCVDKKLAASNPVEQEGALKLIDFLGIPRASLSGTWRVEPPTHVEQQGAKKDDPKPDAQQWQQSYEAPRENRNGDAAYTFTDPTSCEAESERFSSV